MNARITRPLHIRPQYCTTTAAEGGDCYRACLATVTGFDASEMPNFQHLPGVTHGGEGLAKAKEWLEPRGYTIFDTWVTGDMSLSQVLTDCSAYNAGIAIILSGWCTKGQDCHAVVIMDGQIIHDPSGAGVDGPMPSDGETRLDWGLQIIVPLMGETQ